MKTAIRIGISIKDYEDMTPHELNLSVWGYNERMKLENKNNLTLAYLIAGWSKAKRMPSLKKILGEEDKPKVQSDKDMLAKVMALNAAFGGKIIRKPNEDGS